MPRSRRASDDAARMTTNTALSTRDVREGGRWGLAQRFKNDVLYVAATGTLRVALSLPTSTLRCLGRGLAFLVWHGAPGLRRITLANVARGLPSVPPRERLAFARNVYRSLGELLGQTVADLDPRRASPPLRFLPGARECLDAAIAEGRGVVFASAHLGPWERVAASLVSAGVPMTVVAREPYDPRLADVYRRLRDARGVRTVYRGAAGAGVALARVLRKGAVLGIPMDLASRATSIEVPFLGSPAATPVGPARLAIRTGAAVVVGTAALDAEGHLGIAVTRIAPSSCERELTGRINEELSTRIRALPYMWPWMHPRWGRALDGPMRAP